MSNNGDYNGKQRKTKKLPGGVTGRGFQPGQSGNPNGRPRTRGLVNALKAAVEQEMANGQTVEEALADVLIYEALSGKHRVAAINSIYDRIEGKPKQPIAVDEREEFQDELSKMTEEELIEKLRGAVNEHDAKKQESGSTSLL